LISEEPIKSEQCRKVIVKKEKEGVLSTLIGADFLFVVAHSLISPFVIIILG